MSWQPAKAVPLLAGEAFCEKPPLNYWVAGAAIHAFGADAWAARLPNLLYALATALAVGFIGRWGGGPLAGLVAAAAISTFLLSYQVAIWLATDAPLLAFVSVALAGLYRGFYATQTTARLRGYSCMHAALALGFLSKSAAAWMVPVLTLITLVVWEKRWRELLRWELYVGLGLQAAVILSWVWVVYVGPDGPGRLKVFFWNNLVGRFTHVDAAEELQYAAAHRNSPGKYLVELPAYLWPWTLLVLAAARRAWQERRQSAEQGRAVRFAVATFVPALGVLSIAATARNIYVAPALPGVALLLGWWARDLATAHDRWDVRAIHGTSVLLLLTTLAFAAAVCIVGYDSWNVMNAHVLFVASSSLGLAGAAALAISAWRAARRGLLLHGLFALLLSLAALLVGPASQIYRRVDTWQNLATIGRQIERDTTGRPLILFAPDETTRAFVDMYARTAVELLPSPITALSTDRLRRELTSDPRSLVATQLPGRSDSGRFRALAGRLGLGRLAPTARSDSDPLPSWASASGLRIAHEYALPNGRRYALLEADDTAGSR